MLKVDDVRGQAPAVGGGARRGARRRVPPGRVRHDLRPPRDPGIARLSDFIELLDDERSALRHLGFLSPGPA